MSDKRNAFADLYNVDVSGHLEKKNGFSYVSWPFAVAELLKRHPNATWDVKRFDGLPYLKTECGYFVEVGVTVDGIERTQIHPVLDHANRPVAKPNAFQINTSIQRALVKAIGLHGLGLYVYAGEDLPEEIREAQARERQETEAGGDEPQAASAKAAERRVTEAQAEELGYLIEATETDRDAVCRFFQVGALDELSASDYRRLRTKLRKKLAKHEAA